MKKLIWLFLAASAWAQFVSTVPATPAGSVSPSVLHHGGCYAAAASCSITFGSNTTAGSRIFVATMDNSTNTTPTMTGETFTHLTGTSGCSNNTGDTLDCWLVSSAVGGQTVITCNGGSTTTCIAVETSAPQGLSTPKDAGGNTQVASGTSYTVSTSAATTNANDIVIGVFGSLANSSGYSVGSGFTVLDTPSSGGSNNMMSEYKTVAATGTQTATATSGSSARCAEGVIAIKP